MRKIQIVDVSLREQAACNGSSLNFKEKIEVARQLDKLNVDAIARGLFAQRHIDDLNLSHGRLLTTFAFVVPHRAGQSRQKDYKPLIYYLNGRLSSNNR